MFRPGRFVVAQPALRGGGGGGGGGGCGDGSSVALLEGALRRAKTLRAEAEALHARGDARGALRKAREAAELEAEAKHPTMRHQNVNLAWGDSCLASRDVHLDPNRKLAASSSGAPLKQPPMRVAYEYDMSFSMQENSGARGGARPHSAQPFASGQSRAAALEAVARGARRARKQALAHATHALHTLCTHRACTLADAWHGSQVNRTYTAARCMHLQALTLDQLERRHPQGSNIRCEHCHIRVPRPSTLCNACHGRHGTHMHMHMPCIGAYAMRMPCARHARAIHRPLTAGSARRRPARAARATSSRGRGRRAGCPTSTPSRAPRSATGCTLAGQAGQASAHRRRTTSRMERVAVGRQPKEVLARPLSWQP